MSQAEIFSIRQMIALTGLSEFTIRGWESRYSAFEPRRSSTGRREYSKKDIERALLLRELLKRGHKIGTVAKLKNQKLLGLFEQKEGSAAPKSKVATEALELMALQKWYELARLLKKVQSKNSAEIILKFFLPVLSELAVQVRAGKVSVAQEHVFSSLLKERIYSALSDLEKKGTKKVTDQHNKFRFVLATPEGDYHEFGLLLAHLLIRSFGFTSLYLGPHTPARDISETALRFEASHLLLVSTISKKQGARQELLSFVREVQRTASTDMQIWLAGNQVPKSPFAQSTSLLNLASFDEFNESLKILKEKNK